MSKLGAMSKMKSCKIDRIEWEMHVLSSFGLSFCERMESMHMYPLPIHCNKISDTFGETNCRFDTLSNKYFELFFSGGGGDDKKSLYQLRLERRARLWNVTPSGDSGSKPIIRRPGQLTPADSAPEIKIKTLAEIRREKQLREKLTGDQVSSVPEQDSEPESSQRSGSAPVRTANLLKDRETGDQISMLQEEFMEESGKGTDNAPVRTENMFKEQQTGNQVLSRDLTTGRRKRRIDRTTVSVPVSVSEAGDQISVSVGASSSDEIQSNQEETPVQSPTSGSPVKQGDYNA